MKKFSLISISMLILCLAVVLPAEALPKPHERLQAVAIAGIGTALLPAGIEFANAIGPETMRNIETQYDLTGPDADVYHYARLIIYRDYQDLGPVLALIDMVEFKPELVTLLSNTGRNLVAKKLEESGAKLIEWLPASKVFVQKHNGVRFGVRLTLSERFPLPMFAAIAVYPQDGRITGIALLCPDSDRPYWQPVFAQILGSMRAEDRDGR